MPIRVATFNVENLFSRAVVLNGQDPVRNAERLARIGELQALLEQPAYSAADKTRIADLLDALGPFVTLREHRGRRLRAGGQVAVDGRAAWDGELAFKREGVDPAARANTARVIREVNADVLCLVECEDLYTLRAFRDGQLAGMGYDYAILIDGNDSRGIDVGLLSRFPLGDLRTNVHDRVGSDHLFSRDCLEVAVMLPSGRPLHVLCNHFISKYRGDSAWTRDRRAAQAARVAALIGRHDLARDWVVVAGDLNDTPDSEPLRPLLQVDGLHDVLNAAGPWPTARAARWTSAFGDGEQIDYLLVSEALRAAQREFGVERRGIHRAHRYGDGSARSFDTVTRATNAASDHAAVWVDLDVG